MGSLISHLVFDLDGTLVDSRPGILHALRTAARQVQPEIDAAGLEFQIGPPVREMLQSGLQTSDPEELDRLEAAFRASYDGGGWKMTEVYPGLLDTLDTLSRRGIVCHIVTNKPAFATARILIHLGLSRYFDGVLCPDMRAPKFASKSEMLAFLLETRRIATENALYLGDSADDLYAAANCGLGFIGIEYGYGELPQTGERFRRVHSCAEILSVV